MTNTFSREMGFTREEFFRLLPNALNDRPHSIDEAGVTVDASPGSVRIDVGAQQFRHIASISMPYVKVDFEFKNFSDTEREEFLRFFDLRYQRGGG